MLEPAALALANGTEPPKRAYFIEGSKGSGKGFCVALLLLWLLSFSKRRQRIQLAADQQEQASEVPKSMKEIVRHNPILAKRIEFQQTKIVTRERDPHVIEIKTRDESGGAHGSRPTLVAVDELSHCSSENFISDVVENQAKVTAARFCCCVPMPA